MASFQVKTGWKRPRKREYKNYRSVSFQPETQKSQQNTHTQNPKKFKKVQKFSYKGRQYKELQKFLLSLSHSFSPTFVFV